MTWRVPDTEREDPSSTENRDCSSSSRRMSLEVDGASSGSFCGPTRTKRSLQTWSARWNESVNRESYQELSER